MGDCCHRKYNNDLQAVSKIKKITQWCLGEFSSKGGWY